MKQLYIYQILFTLVFIQSALGQFSGGDGTAGDPFLISNATDLDQVRNYRDGKFFKQTADIDLSSITNWEPIGSAGYENRFRGTYDGNGFTISNLTINSPGKDNVGLFGEIGPTNTPNFSNTTTIKNVCLVNVSVAGARGTGSLVGRVTGNENTTIESCYVIGGTVTGDAATGGLVGSNNSYISDEEDFDGRKPKIIKSYAAVDVIFSNIGTDNQKFGGLAGCNQKGRIENSYSRSTVTVQPSGTEVADSVGGLVGCSDLKGDIINSYSTGLVTVNSNVTSYGGLLGSVDSSNPGTISSSYWDTETSGQSESAGGIGRTTAQMQSQATFSGWDFTSIWNIMEGETYPFLRDFDLSGFDITDPGTQTAGAPFEINITNAKDVGGNLLNGSYSVTVTSNFTTEGTGSDGILVNNLDFTFTGGEALITGTVLKKADDHTLTVNVETILESKEQLVTVNPNQAFKLVIDQQPASTITGNHDDEAAGLGPIIVVSHDEYDNPSVVGLGAGQMVTAAIGNDGSAGNDAVLGGTLSVDIQSGSASFNDLTIDKEGTGYTLVFTSASPVSFAPVVSDAFNVENIVDHSGFVVAEPGTSQYEYVEFDLDISGATDQTGAALEGPVNVVVSSDTEGIVYNLNVEFVSGAGSLTVALEEIADHTLTIDITGITLNESMILSVAQDQSAFSVTDPGQQYQDFPFDLEITSAKSRDGIILTGEHQVTVTSDLDSQVYSGNISFTEGQGTVPVALNTTGDHILNVSITDITENVSVGVNVGLNNSGFTVALAESGQKTAGASFNLDITNARSVTGNLNGNYNVNVTSNIEGENLVYDGAVSFTDGVAIFGIDLEKAASSPGHTLTVAIEDITPVLTVDVEVIAAAASRLAITQQPTGGSGGNDGSPVNIGTVIVETWDSYGNPSVSGLATEQNVTVEIQHDPSATNDASLGGTEPLDIQTGTATFSLLTLNRDGEGYTLRFTSASPVDLDSVDTDPFNMTNIKDNTGFDVVDPGPQVVGQNFTVRLINAKNSDGTLRNGEYEIRIQEFSEGEILFMGDVNFSDGTALVTTNDPYIASGESIETRFRISNHIASQEFIYVNVSATDQSGFDITSPGTQTAGTPFSLNITGAKNKAGGDLNGRKHYVTLSSNNLDEGVDGLLFSDSLTFSGGAATIENVQLFDTISKNLTVTIDWVTDPVTESVTVDPAAASQFVIYQQPVGGEGSNNDVAVGVGEIILHFLDDHGNISDVGLDDTGEKYSFTLTADIESGPGEAGLGGTTERGIVDGVVTFNDLTLDLNGTYNLGFTYNGSAPVFNPNTVISVPFDMTNVENLEGFDVVHPGKQYQALPFDLNITNAQNSAGVPLSGLVNVTVTSNKEDDGEVFNGNVTFTDGTATVNNIVLNTTALDHNLTVSVTGITGDVVTDDFEVAEDLSGFNLAADPAEGPFYQDNPFNLVISSATDLDGVSLAESVLVTVTSDQADGVVHNEAVNFESGGVSIPITLQKVIDSHTLTVEIAGVTDNKQVSVNVQSNVSGFDLALAVPGDKTAGVSFDLDITNTINLSGTALDGSGHQVTVTSDLSGEVYNNINVAFTTGAATIPVTLDFADSHILTVSVQNITGTEEIGVNILAATVSKMVIDTQPTGGSGTQNNQPTGIGTVIIRTMDQFNNFSTVGLSGTQEVTVSLETDGSGLTASFGGTKVQSIISGTATFNDLTLDKDGVGYVLRFTYSGDPALANVDSDPFDMVDVNSYQISLDASDPLVFTTQTVGYDPVTATNVQISNMGGGIVTGLGVALSGDNPIDFTVSQPDPTSLNPEGAVTFTVKPNDALGVGSYSAIVTVTADKGISEQFVVNFEVLPEYDITITHGVDEPLDSMNPLVFESLTEGYGALDYITVTISNTGGMEITGLQVNLAGDNETAFETSGLSPTTVPAGQTATFGIRPVTELAPGSYNATVTVDDHETSPNISESFTVTFRVVDEVVWQGTTSDWHAKGNWNGGIVPDQYAVISISATDNDPVISGANATVNKLVIENGASLTVNSPRRLTISSGGKVTVKPGGLLYSTGTLVNNAGSGGLVVESDGSTTGSVIQSSSGVQATVQRYNAVQGWHIISPPVGGEGILHFVNNGSNNIPQNTTSGEYAMTHYIEDRGTGAGGWGAYYNSSTSGNLIPGKGYLLAINTGHSAYFTGELPYSGRTVSITHDANGWNAIGNPFSSAMGVTTEAGSSDNFLGINTGELDPEFAALYVYDLVDKDYKIINNSGGALGLTDGYIQTGQGFMVKSKSGGGSINFTTGMRDHFSSAPFKSASANWSTIRLKVSDTNKKSTTLLAFNSNMTKGLDVTYDAGQYGADPGFRLYSRLVEGGNEVDFAIQALPDYDLGDMVISLGFDFIEGGDVTFSAVEVSLPAGAAAILEDRHLDVFTDLQNSDYTVTIDENSSGPGRFFIHTDIQITNVQEIQEIALKQLEIYSYGKEVFIVGEVKEDSYAKLFDLMGRQIKTVKLENSDRNIFRVDELDRGIYLIRVSGEGAGVAKRVFIE